MRDTELRQWPVRPLMTRIFEDLETFAGIKWWMHSIVGLGFYCPAMVSGLSGADQRWLGAMLAVPRTFHVLLLIFSSHLALADGPDPASRQRAKRMWRTAGFFFWIALSVIWIAPIFTVCFAGKVWSDSAAAWHYSGGGDKGTPFVVRAARRVRTLTASPVPAAQAGN